MSLYYFAHPYDGQKYTDRTIVSSFVLHRRGFLAKL